MTDLTPPNMTEAEIRLLTPPPAAKTSLKPEAPTRIKETVSPEEYALRKRRRERRDYLLVIKEREKRIEKAKADWAGKVGQRFAPATTDDPRIINRIERIASGKGTHKTSIILTGPVGTGKSWLAYSFLNMAVANGAVTPGQIIYDTETGVLGRIASGGFERGSRLEELLHPRNKIFFIDDVGTGYYPVSQGDQGRTELWYELVDHVYTHGLTLILSTNLDLTKKKTGPGTLDHWIGFRAVDRLRSIVGSDGLIVPSLVNRRSEVAAQHEEQYRGPSS